mgnify:CR=1 FL=1
MDWTKWLADDTIASATVTATAPLVADTQTNTTKKVFVWLNSQACAVGDLLSVRCEIVTATGMREASTFYLSIVE